MAPLGSEEAAAPPYRLAIFDLDGTLADSFGWFLATLPAVAARHGFLDALRAADGEALRRMGPREILAALRVPRWRLPLIAREMRRRKAAAIASQEGIRLFPGIPGMLRALSSGGLVLALATSDAEANARRLLGPANAALIRHWGCGAGLFGKARLLRRLLRRSGLPAHAAILIGDEIRDAEAAAATGIAFGAVAWGYNRPAALRATRPALTFGTVADIAPRLLGPAG